MHIPVKKASATVFIASRHGIFSLQNRQKKETFKLNFANFLKGKGQSFKPRYISIRIFVLKPFLASDVIGLLM